MSAMMKWDIVIVGGGVVGCLLAYALRDYRVLLLDAEPFAKNDARLFALNHSSIQFLKKYDLFSALIPHATAIKTVHVSHRGHFGATRIHANDLNIDALGYVIPAHCINQMLEEKLQNSSVQMIRPATVVSIQNESEHVQIGFETPQGKEILQSSLVIAADGTHSTIRELLQISSSMIHYDQSAIVTTTELSRAHHHIAYERFLSSGAIAMLPLANNTCATIWTAPQAIISTLMQGDDKSFLTSLQAEFGFRLGRLKQVGKRYTYPLKNMTAKQKVQGRVILMGNAAHTIHPLAAQGLNLAIHEIVQFAQIMKQQEIPLTPTEEWSSTLLSQQFKMKFSHYLNSIFSTDFLPFNLARQASMVGLDLCPIIKNQFAKLVL